MGVQALRARSANQAERTIRSHPVHIAVVDLSLPWNDCPVHGGPGGAEAGPRVLELLRRLESPPPTVVIRQARGRRDDSRCLAAALRCDAFAVVDRAAADLELMLELLRRVLRRHYHDRWPGQDLRSGPGTMPPETTAPPGQPGR
ncbi:MAG TPA: hypothetical protein VD963_09305 [Phycisphaerales bacterium]|nr:hypothetical protein [Phycisphaerales bacterium]